MTRAPHDLGRSHPVHANEPIGGAVEMKDRNIVRRGTPREDGPAAPLQEPRRDGRGHLPKEAALIGIELAEFRQRDRRGPRASPEPGLRQNRQPLSHRSQGGRDGVGAAAAAEKDHGLWPDDRSQLQGHHSPKGCTPDHGGGGARETIHKTLSDPGQGVTGIDRRPSRHMQTTAQRGCLLVEQPAIRTEAGKKNEIGHRTASRGFVECVVSPLPWHLGRGYGSPVRSRRCVD